MMVAKAPDLTLLLSICQMPEGMSVGAGLSRCILIHASHRTTVPQQSSCDYTHSHFYTHRWIYIGTHANANAIHARMIADYVHTGAWQVNVTHPHNTR